MNYTLENDKIIITVSSFGAELTSVVSKETNREYMWNAGDAWKRHSPVLFPIVGGLVNKTYRLGGKEYHMGQHGFARDMEFDFVEKTADTLTFVLVENEESLKLFPYAFNLFISYTLNESEITVDWRVVNTNDKVMHFSIGGHPAFACPLEGGDQTECYLHFAETGSLSYNWLSSDGLCINKELSLPTEDGYVKLDYNFFDNDAYVLYNDRIRSVALADKNKKDYLIVTFDAPVYGIWSAKGKHAPFVCIEPWYGRCDAVDFNGEWQEREWDNALEAGEEFSASYTIELV